MKHIPVKNNTQTQPEKGVRLCVCVHICGLKKYFHDLLSQHVFLLSNQLR